MADKGGYIGRNPGDASVTIARQTFTPTSETESFTFDSGYTVGLVDVYLNGSKLVDARDYDANTGSTVGLTSAATSGDIVVFKTPADNRTDYIKRLIGLPGDEIKITDGNLFLNGQKVMRNKINLSTQIKCGDENINVDAYEEVLPNGVSYIAVYRKNGSMQNSDLYKVPENHYFFLGDNRDCSKDSRYLNSVGYVSFVNLVGKARIIFFSNDKEKGNLLKVWKWGDIIRTDRFLKTIK